MGIVRMVLGASVLAWVLWNAKTAWMRRIRISMLLKALLLLVVMGIAFWLAGTAVGRQIDSGPFDYIASYIGYAIILFGKFVEEGAANTSQFFGSETFVGMYNFIGNHFGVDEFVYTYHLEWRYLGSVSMGNVYTAYRYWLHDFGIGGMMLVACLYGVFFSVFYEKAKRYVPRIGAARIRLALQSSSHDVFVLRVWDVSHPHMRLRIGDGVRGYHTLHRHCDVAHVSISHIEAGTIG